MSKPSYQQRLGAAIQVRRENIFPPVSQERFAEKINMHRTYYSAIERGEKNLTLRILIKVCAGLDRSPSALLADVERWP